VLLLERMKHVLGALSSQESIDRRVERFAGSRYGVITRAEAIAMGAGRRVIGGRISSGRWEVIHPGVYRLAGVPRSWRQELVAACLACGENAAASHRSAGALEVLPGLAPGPVELTVPRGRRVDRPGLLVHQTVKLDAVDVTTIDGIPVTTPTRTIIDLAAILEANHLEEVLDDALRRRLTSIGRLRWRIEALGRRGRPGIRSIDELVRARRGTGVPGSVLETRFVQLFIKAGLPHPVLQHEIRDNGRLVAIVDLAYPDVKVAVEVDGYRWHSGRARFDRDLARRNALTALGWRVIHATATDLKDPSVLIDRISRALDVTRKERASPKARPRHMP
jgi:putative AbiEi antitoxin of type IV toxin-antitoxin system/uncharacterized protein DUF559